LKGQAEEDRLRERGRVTKGGGGKSGESQRKRVGHFVVERKKPTGDRVLTRKEQNEGWKNWFISGSRPAGERGTKAELLSQHKGGEKLGWTMRKIHARGNMQTDLPQGKIAGDQKEGEERSERGGDAQMPWGEG